MSKNQPQNNYFANSLALSSANNTSRGKIGRPSNTKSTSRDAPRQANTSRTPKSLKIQSIPTLHSYLKQNQSLVKQLSSKQSISNQSGNSHSAKGLSQHSQNTSSSNNIVSKLLQNYISEMMSKQKLNPTSPRPQNPFSKAAAHPSSQKQQQQQ